jgi:DNA-binding NtrC family response regulator
LPEPLRSQPVVVDMRDESLTTLREMQRRHTQRVLEQVGGNKAQAAEILGVSRATVYQLLSHVKEGSANRH